MAQGLQIKRHIKLGLLWLKKWNKPLVAFLTLFIFLCLITIVIIENYHARVTENSQTASSGNVSRETFSDDGNNCNVVYNGSCIVECSKIIDRDISSVVNALNFTICILPEITLDLKEVYFTNNIITVGWLSGLARDVEELTITSPLLGEIGESAFSGPPFEYLKKLVIASSRVKVLRKDALLNSKIEDFQFRCTGRIAIEHNALESVADYLTILQFNQCIDDFQAIRNITGTGTSIFNKLNEIDLRYNTFHVVLNHSLVDAGKLISLYLSENNINSIEVNAFRGIEASLQLLDLQYNKLTSLPEGAFDHFTRGGKIFIQNNPWVCNCDLLWFKQFYVENLELYFKNNNQTIPFTCTTGNYTDVEFCPDMSTPNNENTTVTEPSTNPTSTSTDTTISTTTTEGQSTDGAYIYVYLQCSNITEDTASQDKDRVYSHSVKVRNGSILYDFFQINDTPYFDIEILSNVATAYLVWINSLNSSDYGCVSDIQRSVLLRNLQYGMSYTICLLEESSDAVSPFDCTSLNVPLEWKNRTWIKNKYIPAVIGGVVGVGLVIILVTLLIVFYTIRQNPKLIRGNKRVVIVKNKSADALVMPNYERQPYVPPYISLCTNSEGYLTPKNRIYEQINDRRLWRLNTVSRNVESPHSGFAPRRSVGSVVYEPPPLPPNRPSEKRRHSPRSSSVSDIQTIESN